MVGILKVGLKAAPFGVHQVLEDLRNFGHINFTFPKEGLCLLCLEGRADDRGLISFLSVGEGLGDCFKSVKTGLPEFRRELENRRLNMKALGSRASIGGGGKTTKSVFRRFPFVRP